MAHEESGILMLVQAKGQYSIVLVKYNLQL
jgi:hypothetical protein